jgi:hypothetical protein
MAGKSVLVVDTPSSCKSCKFYDEWWCRIEDHCPEDDMGENGRAIWCPLKPLPQKKNTDFHPNIVYANGWNDCLEEITK